MKAIKNRLVSEKQFLSVAAVLGATLGQASAGEVNGYFRAGAGSNSSHGAQACA